MQENGIVKRSYQEVRLAMLFNYMRGKAKVSENFDQLQRQAMMDAAIIACFFITSILNENLASQLKRTMLLDWGSNSLNIGVTGRGSSF